MLSVPSNHCHLLGVFTHGIELVGECSLDLLASDVRELSFGNQRFSFGSHKFLFKNHDFGRIGVLVLELRNLVCDFLLAY